MAHTPGPWTIDGDDEGYDGVPYIEINTGKCGTSSFKEIAQVQSTFDSDGDGDWIITGENEANARLIAAAPELLEALQVADRRISMMRAALDVIAKRNQADTLESEERERRAALAKAGAA